VAVVVQQAATPAKVAVGVVAGEPVVDLEEDTAHLPIHTPLLVAELVARL
jgi:hypothetical protein